jgi:hypothetical protein
MKQNDNFILVCELRVVEEWLERGRIVLGNKWGMTFTAFCSFNNLIVTWVQKLSWSTHIHTWNRYYRARSCRAIILKIYFYHPQSRLSHFLTWFSICIVINGHFGYISINFFSQKTTYKIVSKSRLRCSTSNIIINAFASKKGAKSIKIIIILWYSQKKNRPLCSNIMMMKFNYAVYMLIPSPCKLCAVAVAAQIATINCLIECDFHIFGVHSTKRSRKLVWLLGKMARVCVPLQAFEISL